MILLKSECVTSSMNIFTIFLTMLVHQIDITQLNQVRSLLCGSDYRCLQVYSRDQGDHAGFDNAEFLGAINTQIADDTAKFPLLAA